MLSKLRVQHYKSLFDTEVDLQPLTVLIGPNGSGKSNICEVIAVLSHFLQKLIAHTSHYVNVIDFFAQSLDTISKNQQNIELKFWQGKQDYILFEVSTPTTTETTPSEKSKNISYLSIYLDYQKRKICIRNIEKNNNEVGQNIFDDASGLRTFLVNSQYPDSFLQNALKKVSIYDFTPVNISSKASSNGSMDRTGQGIAYALVDILHNNRKNFDELEERLTRLVPNIKRIILPRGENQTFLLELVDRYSEHHIPASDISDGTLRILAYSSQEA